MNPSSGKLKLVQLAFVSFILFSVGLLETFNQSQRSFLREGVERRAREELALIRFRLEAAILADIYVAYSISTFITLKPHQDFHEWEALAERIMLDGKHLKAVALAPNDVVHYLYPHEGNRPAIGLDYRTVPNQWYSVEQARKQKRIFLAGPLELVQGGEALIARVPIFSDPPHNDHYWGVCSLVLDWQALIRSVNIDLFTENYHFAMRGVDGSGESGAIFLGNAKTFEQAFATESVLLPYGSWLIALAAKHDLLATLPWYQVHFVRWLGYPVLLLLAFSFIVIYRLYVKANQRAIHDELTGLPNRRYFILLMEEYFERAKKSGDKYPFALLNIDLDKFKTINDTYGHLAGDHVLRVCARRLKSFLREEEVVARIGGDEFLAILPNRSSLTDLENMLSDIEQALCATPIIYENRSIELTISLGYTLFHSTYKDIDDMLRVADENMYHNKHQ